MVLLGYIYIVKNKHFVFCLMCEYINVCNVYIKRDKSDVKQLILGI